MPSNIAVRSHARVMLIAVCLWHPVVSQAAPGRFESPQLQTFPSAKSIKSLAIGDIDGDGDRDMYLAYGNASGVGGVQTPLRDRVMLNQGGGVLLESAMALDTADPRSASEVLLIDIDRDGDLDAVTAGDGSYNGSVVVPAPSRIYRNNSGTLTLLQTLGTAQVAVAMAAADWDSDGDTDIAIGRLTGAVDLYRNDTAVGAAVPVVFASPQRITVSTTEISSVRFARNGAGAAPLLLVLRAFQDLTSPPGVLVLRRNPGNGLYGQPQLVPKPEGGNLQAMAVGDFDLDGRDDVALAMGVLFASTSGYSRVLRASGVGFGAGAEFVDIGQDFPAGDDTSLLAADFNGDGRADLAFGETGEQRCTDEPPGSDFEEERTRYCTGSALNIWIASATGFAHSGQCLGNRRTVGLFAGDLDGDGLQDLISNRVFESGNSGGVYALHGNDGPLSGPSNCCMAETAGEFATPFDKSLGSVRRSDRPKEAAEHIDLAAFADVRDVLMPDSLSGPRLSSRYAQYSDEIVTAMRADPVLWARAATLLALWSSGVRALADGEGETHFVSTEMMQQVDQFLLGVSAVASPGLAQVITEERAALPAFGELEGLDMNQFRDAVLPSDVLLRNGFEAVVP